MLGRAGSWVGAASGGGASLADARVWLYQDYTAGSGPNLTITQNDNGTGITFDSSRIVNSSAAATDDQGNPLYTSTTEIPANIIAISSHTGAAVVLTGTPDVSFGTVRIWYLYAMNSTDSLTGQILAPIFVNDYRSTYLDQQYLNTGLNLSDLTNAGTARTNLGFVAQTSGNVLLGDGGTTFTSDADLFFDVSNTRLGIGTNTPSNTLHVVGTGLISTSLTVPIVYGSSSASGNLSLQSTSDATKGQVRVPDQLAVNAPTTTNGVAVFRMDSNAFTDGVTYEAINGLDVLQQSLADTGQFTAWSPYWSQVYWAYRPSVGSFFTGNQAGIYKLEANAGVTDTSPASMTGSASIAHINTNATANNYSAISFQGAGNLGTVQPDSAVVGVHEVHSTSPTGRLEFYTANAGTFARRMNVAADGQVTMDAYAAGVALFSAAGLISSGQVNLASQVTGVLPVANGGTGQSTYTDGQLLIGNTTGNTLTKATLTAGAGITITNGSGSITIAETRPVKSDEVNLSSGATTHAVTFATANADANYQIGWAFRNTVDTDPAYIPWTVIAKSTTGFTIEWNDALPSANYVGEWSATPYYNP